MRLAWRVEGIRTTGSFHSMKTYCVPYSGLGALQTLSLIPTVILEGIVILTNWLVITET